MTCGLDKNNQIFEAEIFLCRTSGPLASAPDHCSNHVLHQIQHEKLQSSMKLPFPKTLTLVSMMGPWDVCVHVRLWHVLWQARQPHDKVQHHRSQLHVRKCVLVFSRSPRLISNKHSNVSSNQTVQAVDLFYSHTPWPWKLSGVKMSIHTKTHNGYLVQMCMPPHRVAWSFNHYSSIRLVCGILISPSFPSNRISSTWATSSPWPRSHDVCKGRFFVWVCKLILGSAPVHTQATILSNMLN